MKAIVTHIAVICTIAAACSSPVQIASEETATYWKSSVFKRHLEELNPGPGTGRRPGTVRHAASLNYVVSRNRAARIQPALRSGFEIPYVTDRNTPHSAQMSLLGRNAPGLEIGVDYAAEPRSGNRFGTYNRFVSGPPNQWAADNAIVAVIKEEDASDANIQKAVDLGYGAVVVIGRLRFESSAMHADSVSVLQMTPRAFGLTMAISSTGVRSILDAGKSRVFLFPYELEIATEATFAKDVVESNIAGFISGKSPYANRQLVVVAGILGSGGPLAGSPTYRYADTGIGCAVMLELGDRLSGKLRYSALPERSIMFLYLEGGDEMLKGVRSIIRNPVWSQRHTLRILLVGMSDEQSVRVSALFADAGIKTEAFPVQAPESLDESGFIAHPARVDDPSRLSESTVTMVRRDVRVAIDSAAVDAVRIAREVYDRVWELAVEPDSTSNLVRIP